MSNASEIRTGRHVVFSLHTHLVFVTKYRKSILTKPMLKSLKEIFVNVCNLFEAELIEFEGEVDHVHLLIHYPPRVSISKLVNSLKGDLLDYCAKPLLPKLVSLYGKVFFGLLVILLVAAEEHQSVLSKNTFKISVHLSVRFSTHLIANLSQPADTTLQQPLI